MTTHEPLPVPERPDVSPPPEPEEKEAGLYKVVYGHFTKERYVLCSRVAKVCVTDLTSQTYECMLRYLRCTKWNEKEAIKRLEDTLKWRREFGIYDVVTAERVEPEAVSGKNTLFGFDVAGRPNTYIYPLEGGARALQLTVWILERAVDLMSPGVDIVQTHYPERLGLAIAVDMSWMLQLLLKLIRPFIDPVTNEKIRLNAVSRDGAVCDGGKDGKVLIEGDQLMRKGWGGNVEFEYEHEQYWPKLVEMCKKRREGMHEAWKELGGTIGIKEWDVKMALKTQESVDASATLAE